MKARGRSEKPRAGGVDRATRDAKPSRRSRVGGATRAAPVDAPAIDLDALVRSARVARRAAYAPYSGYRVGAALLADDGRVFVGVNVENSAYPSGLCAEHAAVGAAVTAGARRFRAVAVVTEPKPGARPGAPCGKCRQVLAEFGLELVVALAGTRGAAEVVRLADLLPNAFTAADLTK